MRAVRIVDGTPTVVDAPDPSGDGVAVTVASAGICGSDLHMIEAGIVEGRILGHEVAGRTTGGKPVAIEPIIRCARCPSCSRGEWNHCQDSVMLGVFAEGGMAERIVVPEDCIVALDPIIDPADAALVEPLAVAYHGFHRARASSNDRIAIVGAGPIGLAMTAVCSAEGCRADVVARHEHQQLAVHRLGGEVGSTDGYDIIFDAVGTDTSLADSIRLCRPAGRVGLVGSLWHPASIDVGLCVKEIELIPAMGYCSTTGVRDADRAAKLLATEPAIAKALITHRFPLDSAAEAFQVARDRSAGSIKVVLDPHA